MGMLLFVAKDRSASQRAWALSWDPGLTLRSLEGSKPASSQWRTPQLLCGKQNAVCSCALRELTKEFPSATTVHNCFPRWEATPPEKGKQQTSASLSKGLLAFCSSASKHILAPVELILVCCVKWLYKSCVFMLGTRFIKWTIFILPAWVILCPVSLGSHVQTMIHFPLSIFP